MALLCVIAAAVFGAIASVAPSSESAWVAGAATVASAVGAFLGRQFVSTGDEAGWIQARAVAEGVKSECYRYAARAGAYALSDADAAKALAARSDEIIKAATDKGLVRGDNPVPEGGGDKREPPTPMTKDWYATRGPDPGPDRLLPERAQEEPRRGRSALVGRFRRGPCGCGCRRLRCVAAGDRAVDRSGDDDRGLDRGLWPHRPAQVSHCELRGDAVEARGNPRARQGGADEPPRPGCNDRGFARERAQGVAAANARHAAPAAADSKAS